MGPMICPRCGTPLWAVADGVVYVRCGHRPTSTARPPAGDLLEAYERWSYGEGWTDGLADGRRQGFDDGFRAGFDAGAEVGAVRVLLALENVLQDQLPDLLPELPHTGEYDAYRKRHAVRREVASIAERTTEEHLTRTLGLRFVTRPDGKSRARRGNHDGAGLCVVERRQWRSGAG